MTKLNYRILGIAAIVLALAPTKIFADEARTCSSVLPFICNAPDCSDNKKISVLCDGKISFTEQGTECMKPLIAMAKCTRAQNTTPSVVASGQPGVWYITMKAGKPDVLKAADDISKLFAPVTDAKTAQGVALLLTEDFPLFAPPFPSLNNGWCSESANIGKWLNRDAAVTRVDKVDKGFQVRLFTISHTKDSDILQARNYIISADGKIVDQALSAKPLWICIPGKKTK